jgi:hypothetical protein
VSPLEKQTNTWSVNGDMYVGAAPPKHPVLLFVGLVQSVVQCWLRVFLLELASLAGLVVVCRGLLWSLSFVTTANIIIHDNDNY